MNKAPIIRKYIITENIKYLFPSLKKNPKYFYKIILPVTKKCYSQCIFCGKMDIPCNIARKDLSMIYTPKEAIALLKHIHLDNIVLEIGGWGDPLYNDETFQTLRLSVIENIDIPAFITTNGLLLPKHTDDILSVNINTIKLIINSMDPNIGNKLIEFIDFRGTRIFGIESAFLFQEMQISGIKRLLKKKINIVVETMLFPDLNDLHIIEMVDIFNMLDIKYLDLKPYQYNSKSLQAYASICKKIKDKIEIVHF